MEDVPLVVLANHRNSTLVPNKKSTHGTFLLLLRQILPRLGLTVKKAPPEQGGGVTLPLAAWGHLGRHHGVLGGRLGRGGVLGPR